MENYQLTTEQIDNMQHAIGYKPYNVVDGVLEYYRNYYDCEDNKGWNDLVEKGLATKREDIFCAGYYVYSLTSNGIDVLSKICKCKFVERR